MTEWLDQNQPGAELDLRHLDLTSLPEILPASLQKLKASNNQLTSLPKNLPASLKTLEVDYNQLTHLPEKLPASLTRLNVTGNQLTFFPDNLPTSLTHLDFSHNLVTSLPENVTARLSSECKIDLCNNPLTERARSNLRATMNVDNYRGAAVYFSMPVAARSEVVTPTPLSEAVARWYDPADQAAATQKWSDFSNEPYAQDFAAFLDRFKHTLDADSPQFQHTTAEWLSHLADHPSLRSDTFVTSLYATTTCNDRVTLALNGMKAARVTADIERGDYDHRLPELMTLAKGMFRLDQLEGIAREKVKSLPFVDEIEVHLAYQVKLREPLALPVDTAEMQYFAVSGVSPQDLRDAQTRVLAAERRGFPDFLASQWQPWQSVLKRLAPERHAQAQAQLREAMGEPLEQRLQQRLQETGLQNDPDARRAFGPQVSADITREIKLPLTRDVLAERGLLAHIETC